MTTVTQWFDGDLNPQRVGLYQTGWQNQDGSVDLMFMPTHRFDGVLWVGRYKTIADAYRGCYRKPVWRGLAERAK